MDVKQYFSQVSLESWAIAIAITLLALVLLLLLNRKRIANRLAQWRIQRCLDQIGLEQIRNLVCDDGLDGHYTIDRLALVADAILVISYKPYSGNIFCAERISEWTQVIEQKSFKFENPLFELENQLTSVRMVSGDVPLRGYLFFDQRATFPKGHPDNVLHPGNIPSRYMQPNIVAPASKIQAAWEALKAHQPGASDPQRLGAKT